MVGICFGSFWVILAGFGRFWVFVCSCGLFWLVYNRKVSENYKILLYFFCSLSPYPIILTEHIVLIRPLL